MKGAAILLLQTLKRSRWVLFALSVLLSLFQILLIYMARSYELAGSFSQMAQLIPPIFREMIGSALPSFMSFGGMVCLGYFHPIVMASLMGLAISVATGPTAEIELGFMDLILARPIARHWIITRTVVASIISAAIPVCCMLAATILGLKFLAPPTAAVPSHQLVFSLGANLGLLMFCMAGLTLLIASMSQRRGAAGWIAGLFAVALFLLDYLGRAWPAVEKFSWLSPFRYYDPLSLIMGKPLPPSHLVALFVTGAVAAGLSYILFHRRDITH
jgi:ABC-type transport system involved in multi-copper enzyme maturation permease subunit